MSTYLSISTLRVLLANFHSFGLRILYCGLENSFDVASYLGVALCKYFLIKLAKSNRPCLEIANILP